MTRELLAKILMLAVLLQGSVAAFAAGSPSMSTGCQTSSMARADSLQGTCCPKGQHAMSCCLDLCASSLAATTAPILRVVLLPVPVTVQGPKPTIFDSRGDSPLIRPPIL